MTPEFADGERYNGRPLVRLLELYVLAVIGELPDHERSVLQRMSSKLTEIYGGSDWREAVRRAVNLPPTVDATLRQMWCDNLEIARNNKVVLQPDAFATMFVDHNFSNP